jgi:hypothetical protein
MVGGRSIAVMGRHCSKAPPGQRFVVEDLSIPRAYRDAAAAAFQLLPGTVAGSQNADQAQQRLDNDLLGADANGALNSSMLYLCMAQDHSGGYVSIDGLGNLQIQWSPQTRCLGLSACFRTKTRYTENGHDVTVQCRIDAQIKQNKGKRHPYLFRGTCDAAETNPL